MLDTKSAMATSAAAPSHNSGNAGNAVWLSFLISAIIAMFTALSYAELASIFKGDAGEYDYVKSSMGNKFGFFVAMSMIIGTIISSAAVSLGFANYFTRFFKSNCNLT